ncbi:hypothetical protein [Bacillus sp. NEB1478]|uniref:hypothetical protein n=1 Tax=Bacillus sp. NEB1478 TaxID=3073816 RepID=UPI00287332EE|nr:hypothetical protein [Bacillus sp. NEB1478]WNB93363.1 hypothetical protein RGB74_06760 [Bacillus sp. NEB1478]
MKSVYENSFDSNEWFVIISLVALCALVWFLPRIFSWLEGFFHFTIGIYIGMFYDHTISVKPWDFYDVNDTSAYQFIDFLSYIMYGPYSYLFMYLYVKLRIKGLMIIGYLLIWTFFSLILEYISVKIGLFHYEKGFKMHWSIVIYLSAQMLQILLFHIIRAKEKTEKVH